MNENAHETTFYFYHFESKDNIHLIIFFYLDNHQIRKLNDEFKCLK